MYYEARAIGSITTPPPTGSYSLTFKTPEVSNSSCLTDSSQKAAWSCDLVPTSTFNISVGAFQGTQLGAVIQPLKSKNATLQYGAQTLDIEIRYTQFLSVEDTEHPDLGPAWFFQDTYDKVVLLPETSFQDNTEESDGAPKAGDKPWLCTLNSTIVQGFLYVDQERQTTANSSSSVTDALEQFPLLVKFEERRDAKYGPKGSCQQYQVLDDGSMQWVSDSYGKPNVVELDEDDGVDEGCRCVWMSES